MEQSAEEKLLMTDVEKILEQSEKYDVVTFDVFDTLIIRDVLKPADVFRLAYGEIGRYLRVIAEMTARKRSGKDEITLDDIQKYFPFSVKKEIVIEKKVCRANPVFLDLVNRLTGLGKKVYAISDMYLSGEVISGILKRSGYDIPVFVSSEYNCRKKDGGLFEKFLTEYGYDRNEVLHIGDDIETDVMGAVKVGIASVKIEKHSDKLRYVKPYLKNLELSAFINHGINEITDPAERIGYEVMGPVILSFCDRIHKIQTENGFDKLFFLARDMHFIMDIYRKMYDDPVSYLYISRKSLQYARKSPEEMRLYLEREGFFGNVAIVDAGWVGTAQIELSRYASLIDPSSDIGGIYIGTNLMYYFRKRSKKSYSCIYSSFADILRCELSSAFMESLIGSSEKQVVSYEAGHPVFIGCKETYEMTPLKAGAERFISDWNRCRINAQIDASQICKTFHRLFKYPRKEDIKLLSEIRFDDVSESDIVTFRGRNAYKGNISLLVEDISLSPWKGGFFKEYFKHSGIPLNIYIWLNTVRNIIMDARHIIKDDLG